jgi:hypothetical protein
MENTTELDEHTFDEANFPDVFPQDVSLEAKMKLIEQLGELMELHGWSKPSDHFLLTQHIAEDVYRYNTKT